MKVAVFDLETNYVIQKGSTHEVIQIASVKIDLARNSIENDSFDVLVNRRNQKDINHLTKQMTGLNNYLKMERYKFDEAFAQFLRYSSDCDFICAWSESDFHILTDNCLHYDSTTFDWALKYVDVQKDISQHLSNQRAISLEKALSISEIEFEGRQHNAFYDALNTGKLILRYKNVIKFEPFINSLNLYSPLYRKCSRCEETVYVRKFKPNGSVCELCTIKKLIKRFNYLYHN